MRIPRKITAVSTMALALGLSSAGLGYASLTSDEGASVRPARGLNTPALSAKNQNYLRYADNDRDSDNDHGGRGGDRDNDHGGRDRDSDRDRRSDRYGGGDRDRYGSSYNRSDRGDGQSWQQRQRRVEDDPFWKQRQRREERARNR